jgi:hypothetical protein
MNGQFEEVIPLKMREGTRRAEIKLPAPFFHFVSQLMTNFPGLKDLSNILVFFNQLSTRNFWTTDELKKLALEINNENLQVTVIEQKKLAAYERLINHNDKQRKWGIIYQNKLYIPANESFTVENIKQIIKTQPESLIAIKSTAELQPFIVEVPAKELNIVFFDKNT